MGMSLTGNDEGDRRVDLASDGRFTGTELGLGLGMGIAISPPPGPDNESGAAGVGAELGAG